MIKEEILEHQEERTMKRVKISVNRDFFIFLSFDMKQKLQYCLTWVSLYMEEIFKTIRL